MYQPLDKATREIQLLSLCLASGLSEPLRGSIRVRSIDDAVNGYVAFSYVCKWHLIFQKKLVQQTQSVVHDRTRDAPSRGELS